MLKTVARFVERPIWKEFQSIRGSYGYYMAKLENKNGIFTCSFGKKYLENYSLEKKFCFLKCEKGSRSFNCREIEFLNDNEEITFWEEIAVKTKNNQSDLQKENQELKQQLAEIKKQLAEVLDERKNSLIGQITKVEKETPVEVREEKFSNPDEKNLFGSEQKFNSFEEEFAKLISLLNEEQKRVFYLAVKEKVNLFFTGAAGTGKSFLLKKIITALELLYGKKGVAVTALTGIAANNINGRTLHSFAGIGLGTESLSELVKRIQGSKRDQKRWQVAKVLIIDEISMLDGDLLDSLEFIARMVRNNQQPFGGLQLIFTGDFFQLPPVSRDKKSFQFSFEAQSWKKCLNHFILLTKIHRQTENKLIELLNEVRFGEISPTGLAMLENLEQEPKFPVDGIEATQLYATNEEVNKINQTELAKLPYPSHFYSAIDWEGATKRLPELLRGCLAPSELQLKLNAQVMLIKNLSPKLANGSQGIIVDFQEQKECKVNYYDWESKKRKTAAQTLILPVVKFTNGIKKVIELAEWKSEIPYTHIVQASRQQIPLVLSWAITIHKSQGQSIERLKIDCQNIFAKGQLYVALSRATSVKYLQVIGFKKNHIMFSHPKVNNFYQTLLENQTSVKDIVSERKK